MNLWPDLDNNLQKSPDLPVHGRTRRLTERLVLSSLRHWLLCNYIPSYCLSLGATRIFRRCYWVDALSIESKASTIPPDKTETVQESHPGKKRKKSAPPLLLPPALQPIAKITQTLAQSPQPITLYGLILDAGSSKRKETRAYQDNGIVATAKNITLPKESGIIRASWLEVAPGVLKDIEQTPAIFLLNPLSHTPFTYDDLAPIYARTVPTELCLLIPHKQIMSHLYSAQRSSIQATTLTNLLRTDRWKTLSVLEEDVEQAIEGFLALFIASIQRHFLLPIQRIALPMQVGPATVENIPYTLLFATRRQDSLLSMNDALCLYRRHLYEQSHRGVLGEEWFITQQQQRYRENLQRLYQDILQQGKMQRIRRWPDLRQHVLLANFGQFTSYDYDLTVKQLLTNQEVRCEWRRNGQPSPEDGDARLPGFDDTLLWR